MKLFAARLASLNFATPSAETHHRNILATNAVINPNADITTSYATHFARRRRKLLKIPQVTVVTDYDAHAYWANYPNEKVRYCHLQIDELKMRVKDPLLTLQIQSLMRFASLIAVLRRTGRRRGQFDPRQSDDRRGRYPRDGHPMRTGLLGGAIEEKVH